MPHSVTLSAAKGLSRWVARCFAAAQHDKMVTPAASHGCHPERSEGPVALGSEMPPGRRKRPRPYTTWATTPVFLLSAKIYRINVQFHEMELVKIYLCN